MTTPEAFASDHPVHAAVRAMFVGAPFVQALGIELVGVGPGWTETRLPLRADHLQQSGVVHAGVLGTIADHTAGGAATTVLPAGRFVLSIEFKVNLLRGAQGEALFCRGEVLKAGRSVTVAEAVVFAERAGVRTLVAKATVTLAVVEPRSDESHSGNSRSSG